MQRHSPKIDQQNKDSFETARTELAALKKPREDDPEPLQKKYHEAKPLAESKALESARPLIAELESLLSSEVLDGKLMKAAIYGMEHQPAWPNLPSKANITKLCSISFLQMRS